MDYTIKLPLAAWQVIGAALSELPFKTAHPILAALEQQVAEQKAAEAAAPKPEAPSSETPAVH